MTLRHKVTGEEVEGNFRPSLGFWQQDTPRLVSYSMDQWEEVVSEDSPQS